MQKWTVVKGMIPKIKTRMLLLCLKNGKCKINKYNSSLFIAEEICSWLSPFHKQTTSPFTPPTKVTAKNVYLWR